VNPLTKTKKTHWQSEDFGLQHSNIKLEVAIAKEIVATMDRKVALVTGITGQDGSYLAEFLLKKGYTVSGGRFLLQSVLP
jgi:hypothetical protein